MTFVINTPIRPQRGRHDDEPSNPQIQLASNQDFLTRVMGDPKRVHYVSRDKLYVVMDKVTQYGYEHDRAAYGVADISLGVQTLHQSFAAHVPFTLTPDWVWYMIVHEVAEHVRQNSARYAGLFTQTPDERQMIEVRDDSLRYDAPSDWGRAIELFRAPIRDAVTERTLRLFTPKFSTTTVEDETTILLAFMDTISSYYEFTMRTMCGIPQILLDGTADDWATLHDMAAALAGEFEGLSGYFSDLLPVLAQIYSTAATQQVDRDFWCSIYKYDGGSGGPYINGWITAFFAHQQTRQGAVLRDSFDWESMARSSFGGFQSNDFPAHVSQVPFNWDYLGTVYPMTFAAGILGVDNRDGFMSPRLGFAVVEN